MNLEAARKLAGREEIDYQFLLSILNEYSHPRDKISAWLQVGDLIRVKKGIYVFGPRVAQTAYSIEVLANLIYGPSAISLSYALSFYGLIPERVNTITSITNKRNKFFSTPVGEFTYQYLHPLKYPVEIELHESTSTHHFLIASPEKALCDHIYLIDKRISLATMDELEHYLFHDLRIDEAALRKFRITKLNQISTTYQDARLILLADFIKKWKAS
jgi:hypothetical protein